MRGDCREKPIARCKRSKRKIKTKLIPKIIDHGKKSLDADCSAPHLEYSAEDNNICAATAARSTFLAERYAFVVGLEGSTPLCSDNKRSKVPCS